MALSSAPALTQVSYSSCHRRGDDDLVAVLNQRRLRLEKPHVLAVDIDINEAAEGPVLVEYSLADGRVPGTEDLDSPF